MTKNIGTHSTNVSAVNLAPTVNASADQTITSLAPANLNATVTDDGLPIPPGAVTMNWTVVSGPGTVTFGDSTQAATTAFFSQVGTYVLRLTASDGVLSANDDITIQVDLPPSPGTRITNGLVVYYPFTQGVGSTVLDQSNVGSPMDLTITGNVTSSLADIGYVGNDSFRYHLSDGESVVSTTVDTTNVSAVNLAPTVNAGADQTITSLAPANLNATVTDDGLPIPPGAVTMNWTVVSGPGTVTFGDSTQAATTAFFSQVGTYVLRLTASDGVLSANDDEEHRYPLD